MIDNHIDHITSVDILTPEPGQYQFIKFDASVNLDDFEKIHSGGSSGSYLLRSIAHPNVCMRVERGEFFRSLLQKRSDELLISSGLGCPDGSRAPGGGRRCTGSGPMQNRHQLSSQELQGRHATVACHCDVLTARNGRRHTTRSTRASRSMGPLKPSDQYPESRSWVPPPALNIRW